MARVRPFHALHFLEDRAARIVERPERSGPDARRVAAAGDPHHPLQLDAAPQPGALVRRWAQEGALARSDRAALHVLEVEPLPLERVYRSTSRMLLALISPEPGLEPLEEAGEPLRLPLPWPVPALAADDQHVIRELLEESIAQMFPIHETRGGSGVYRLFRVEPSAASRRLVAVLGEAPVRPLGPLATEAPTLAAIHPMSDPGLRLRPIHRAIRNVPTFHAERFLTLVREYARVYEIESPLDSAQGLLEARERLAMLSSGHHAVLLVLPDGRGRLLRFRQALELDHVRAAPKSPTLRSLDLALLNALVLRTVIGLEHPGRIGHPQVFDLAGLEELIAGVLGGTFQAGFALNPPPLWEVRAVIAAGQQLPPRTLRVTPAPPLGAVFYDPEQP